MLFVCVLFYLFYWLYCCNEINCMSWIYYLLFAQGNAEWERESDREHTKICLIHLRRRQKGGRQQLHMKWFGSFDSITEHQCHRLLECDAQIIYNWKYFNYWNSIDRFLSFSRTSTLSLSLSHTHSLPLSLASQACDCNSICCAFVLSRVCHSWSLAIILFVAGNRCIRASASSVIWIWHSSAIDAGSLH